MTGFIAGRPTAGIKLDATARRFAEQIIHYKNRADRPQSMTLDADDPSQCSCAEHSGRHGLPGLRAFVAGKLPFIEVRQNSGSGDMVNS